MLERGSMDSDIIMESVVVLFGNDVGSFLNEIKWFYPELFFASIENGLC